MAMKIKVELKPIQNIFVSLGIQEHGKAQLFLTNEAYRRMSKYVPFRTGKLRDTTTIKPGSVTYEVKYAKRQYYNNKGSGIRGKFWDKRMMSAEQNQLTSDLQKYISGGNR